MDFDEYLRKTWESLPGQDGDERTRRRIWTGIHRRILIEKYAWKITAAVTAAAACIVAGIFVWNHGESTVNGSVDAATLVSYTAQLNEDIILPDGSKVWLDAGSTITYPDKMDKDRTVTLSGDAVFDVVKTPDQMHFLVNLESSSIEVKGTSFSVNHIEGKEVSVVLYSGAVDFVSTANGQTVVMKPNNKLVFSLEDQSIHVSPSFPGISWNDGTYMVKNAPLNSLVQFVSWKYGVDVNLSPSIGNSQRMNGQILHKDTCEAVLDKICFMLDLEYCKEGQQYRIFSR